MFFIIELQTFQNGASSSIVQSAETLQQAKSIYHTVLASAAISELPAHAATLLTNMGALIASECYTHEPEPAADMEE